MEDIQFLTELNEIARRHRLRIPILRADEAPPSGFLTQWAHFLETCLKTGIELSDPRWKRVCIETNSPHVRFSLGSGSSDVPVDPDFRVGLQLLMGMLGEAANEEHDDM